MPEQAVEHQDQVGETAQLCILWNHAYYNESGHTPIRPPAPCVIVLYNINVEDLDILLRLLLVCPYILNLVDDIKSLCCAAKDGVLAVQPGLRYKSVIHLLAW